MKIIYMYMYVPGQFSFQAPVQDLAVPPLEVDFPVIILNGTYSVNTTTQLWCHNNNLLVTKV
jgi:hypothetical protein